MTAERDDTDDTGAFEASYGAWRARPFPHGSRDDALDELHADLALADHWVAESTIPYVEHGLHDPAKVDVIDGLLSLRNRAVELSEDRGGEEYLLAVAYRDYADALLRVYRSFLLLGDRLDRQRGGPRGPGAHTVSKYHRGPI